jgi:SAM-dependent methyltransferase
MIEAANALAVNRAGWDQVAPSFHGGTALPEYGPLAPTEDTLRLLELTPELRALELGCGSGHSLRYLAERGARELWGVDLSPVQVAFAEETLRAFAPRCRLFESPMEVNPGIPSGHFDLVLALSGEPVGEQPDPWHAGSSLGARTYAAVLVNSRQLAYRTCLTTRSSAAVRRRRRRRKWLQKRLKTARNRWADSTDLNRRITYSRSRVGWCDCSTRLFSRAAARTRRCSTDASSGSRTFAAP